MRVGVSHGISRAQLIELTGESAFQSQFFLFFRRRRYHHYLLLLRVKNKLNYAH